MSRSSVLFLLPSATGVSAKHFVQAHSVCASVFGPVDVATADGTLSHSVFADLDESAAKYVSEKRVVESARILDSIDPLVENYAGLVVPDAEGFYFEEQNEQIYSLMEHFVKFKKPICLVGNGTAALFSTTPKGNSDWLFRKYALTAPSNTDLLKSNKYTSHKSIEDFIVDYFGKYSSGRNESMHVVVDGGVVSAQHRNSTLIAIQTFILLVNRTQ